VARAVTIADAEAPPESDRLEGFPHPREPKLLFGFGAAETTFANALRSDSMHHAWLLAGVAGSGKATLAYRVARAALARADERGIICDGLDIDNASPTARQILAQAHPGLLVIRRAYDQKAKRFTASISVDEVRRLKGFLSLSAEEGGRRVVIVDSADELNVNAANALLKSLEEPPPRTLFLILTAAPGRLLPTIRSRCRTLNLPPLAPDDLEAAAKAAMAAAGKSIPDDADWSKMAAISGGSVRRAAALLQGDGLALQARVERLLGALPKLDLKAAHQLSDDLQGITQDAKFSLFYDLLLDTIARLIRSEATGEGGAEERALASRLIGPARLATFAELWETLGRERAETQTLNLDRKALILASLTRIEAASRV
jgi:DNA polymerase-3 subunit delta'